MYSRKLLVPLMATVSLTALFTPSALASKHPSPNGACHINITVAPRVIVAGDPVVIFGQLRCANPATEAGKEVRLFHHLLGSPGYSYVQSTTTEANGFYSFDRADGVVDTNRSWYVRSNGAQSGAKSIRVAAQVTLSGPPTAPLLTGRAHRVTFTGTVIPADVGARVVLQRQNATSGTQWRRIDSGVVGAGGAFAIAHTFVVPGDANIRVLVRSQGRNVPSSSNVLAYVISQAQNPALTIQASADPISFGETATISGKLAGGANLPVTLMGHTARQHGFARIAQVSTNAAGEYSFPAQSPVNSTFYKVTAAKVSSAVLYEGVGDALTAHVSSLTVGAGQPITFSGTVAPDHTGHAIYLERRNASGTDFHVVQVGVVGAGSAYSLVHRVYDVGTGVFRIHIPGGPENQSAVSPPFTIVVTPALASTLTPEAPGNATVPPEGQS